MQLEAVGVPQPSATEEGNTYLALMVAAGSILPCLWLRVPICRGRILATWHQLTLYNEACWSFVQVGGAREGARFCSVS